MNEDKIAEIRARHESPGVMLPMEALGQAIADRAVLLAEVERQALYIEWLREKIDAERSCACSFDAPGDVCAAHSPALTQALAEIERLRARVEVLERACRLIEADPDPHAVVECVACYRHSRLAYHALEAKS
jgi:hypothetical protein